MNMYNNLELVANQKRQNSELNFYYIGDIPVLTNFVNMKFWLFSYWLLSICGELMLGIAIAI